jgi:hypothetical protein
MLHDMKGRMQMKRSRVFGALAVGVAIAAVTAGAAHADDAYVANGWGEARFFGDGDKLLVCDTVTDGIKVRASIQKWYGATSSWQAIGVNDAPSSSCDTKVIDIEPDTSLVRIHIWAEDGGVKVSGSDEYSQSFNATP